LARHRERLPQARNASTMNIGRMKENKNGPPRQENLPSSREA
jgi:hypothetical protein